MEGLKYEQKKKFVNNSGIPDHIIESIARCILPDIIEYYKTEEGQQQFEEWKTMQATKEVAGENRATTNK